MEGCTMLKLLAIFLLPVSAFALIGPVNLAYNKTAKLSQNYSKPFPADLAVNGILTDFTQTSIDAINNWWMVDLAANYSLAKIVIYSRSGYVDRMTGISILTSNSAEEVDSPSLDSSNWTRISYKASYSLIETLDLSPSRDARHLAVYNIHAKGLALAEVEVFAAINLASNKTARQSTEYNGNGVNFSASNAVNGRLDDFSHTGENKTFNWWKVDLGRKYSLGSIILHDRTGTADVEGRLKWVHILISNSAGEPSSPSLSSPDWIQLSYRESPYPSVGSVEFTPPAEAQHVAVYNNHSKGLCLVEVQIYEYNYAADKPASQSSSYNNENSGQANDGDLSTSSNTDFINHKTNQWWKVDLQRRIVLREIKVYVRNGLCDGGSTNCSSRLQEVYLLSNPNPVTTPPSTTGENGWSTCYFRNTSIKEEFTEQCDIGLQNPVTRLFSLRNNKGITVELREVEIFGFELPQLTAAINVTTEAITSNSISISFLQWKQEMIGGFPPTQYRITLSGKDPMFPEHQNSSSQRINVTFDLLNPGQVHNISIACSIQGIDCPGPVQYIQATTNCTAPDSIEPLNIDCQQSTDGFPIYWNCTANWTRANANCPGNVRYLYGINGTYTNETDKNSVIFSLNGHQLYNFIVKARNSENIVSAPVNKSQQSGVLEPVSGPRVEKTTSNGTCVYVSWNPPNSRDANGEIIAYRHRCTNRTAWNETVSTSLEYCGYEPEQSVTCEIQASTSKGFGPSTTVSAIIQCTEPPQPHFNIASFKNTSASASLIIILEKSQSLCSSVPYYIIKVQHLNGSVIYQDTVLTSGNFVIQNLSGFTTYIVTVEVRIGDNLKSETSLTVLTVETEVPGEPHIERLTSTPNCVFINASKPLDPNGVITAYLFSCQPNPETVINVPPTATHVATQLCGLPSSSLINCSVRAVNSIGTGMPVYVSTYTELKLLFSSPPKLLSLDASKTALVRVKIFQVETERNDTNIRSYLVLLQDSEVTKAEDSEPIVCDVVKGNCMTAAEIESNVVTTDGYIFYIGDGKEYGEYINRPLTPGNSYILQLAISVQLFSDDDVYYQTIAGMTSITAPSAFCEPPPIIANAIVGNSSKAKVGQEVLYACDDGYQRTSGNYQLTCTITKSYKTLWTGEHPNCSKTQGVAIGLGVATLAVILAVGILVVYLKWKKQPFSESESSPAQSGNSGDYMVPARAKPSEYSSLELQVDSRVCKYDSCEGELVGENLIGDDAYETVSYE